LPPEEDRLKKLLSLSGLALLVTVLAAAPAAAITYGEPDGTTHKNVGALIADWDADNPGLEQLCSGTLISPTVYLTAAHCTAYLESLGMSTAYVSFDVDVDPVTTKTKLYLGTLHSHPGYDQAQSDPKDIAVVTFAKPITGITPASLPEAGVFDSMKAAGTLNGQKFTAVGYGVHEPEVGGGPSTFPYDGERWRSVSEFNALNNVWLRLSQNDATGDSGTCYGDSGGPNFLGTGSATVPGTLASITVTGDAMCLSTNVTYRLDTKPARDFLGQFVRLP
jgi:secreted trypsin-like serine protease